MGKLKGEGNAIIKTTCFLLVLCFIVTLAVAGTNALTAERIAEQERLARSAAMERLLPAAYYVPVLENETGQGIVYQATTGAQQGESLGYIIITAGRGYGGPVRVMTAITQGTVVAIEIIDASGETPGLGQNVLRPSFIEQFSGVASPPVLTRGVPANADEIQSLTGATLSADAVVSAVGQAMELYESIQGGGR